MEDTYCIIKNKLGNNNIIANFAVGDEEVLFTGTYQQCKDYIAFQNECAQGQDLLDQQQISDAYEEMQELDPRDYYRVDDFGDPCT